MPARCARGRRCDGIADAAAIHQVAPADHLHQLFDHAAGQGYILLFAGNVQIGAAQGDIHGAFLFDQRHVLVIEAEQGHIGVHGIHGQKQCLGRCQMTSLPFIPDDPALSRLFGIRSPSGNRHAGCGRLFAHYFPPLAHGDRQYSLSLYHTTISPNVNQ